MERLMNIEGLMKTNGKFLLTPTVAAVGQLGTLDVQHGTEPR